jgi:hypothetical protein
MAQSGHPDSAEPCPLSGVLNSAKPCRVSPLLALQLCLHVGKRGVSALLQGQLDTFHEQIMDFPSFVKGDLPQRLVGSLWQINARVLDVRSRAAA